MPSLPPFRRRRTCRPAGCRPCRRGRAWPPPGSPAACGSVTAPRRVAAGVTSVAAEPAELATSCSGSVRPAARRRSSDHRDRVPQDASSRPAGIHSPRTSSAARPRIKRRGGHRHCGAVTVRAGQLAAGPVTIPAVVRAKATNARPSRASRSSGNTGLAVGEARPARWSVRTGTGRTAASPEPRTRPAAARRR